MNSIKMNYALVLVCSCRPHAHFKEVTVRMRIPLGVSTLSIKLTSTELILNCTSPRSLSSPGTTLSFQEFPKLVLATLPPLLLPWWQLGEGLAVLSCKVFCLGGLAALVCRVFLFQPQDPHSKQALLLRNSKRLKKPKIFAFLPQMKDLAYSNLFSNSFLSQASYHLTFPIHSQGHNNILA